MLLSLYRSTFVPQSFHNCTSVTPPACLHTVIISTTLAPTVYSITPSSPCTLPIHIFQNRPLHRTRHISVYSLFSLPFHRILILLFSPYCHTLLTNLFFSLLYLSSFYCHVSRPPPFGPYRSQFAAVFPWRRTHIPSPE